jgi:hypothetical protein
LLGLKLGQNLQKGKFGLQFSFRCSLYLDLNYGKYEKPCMALGESELDQFNSRRAGGPAWLRHRLDMAGIEGSNPFRPTIKLVLLWDSRSNQNENDTRTIKEFNRSFRSTMFGRIALFLFAINSPQEARKGKGLVISVLEKTIEREMQLTDSRIGPKTLDILQVKASEPSEPSEVRHSIRRLYPRSDVWTCDFCNVKTDRHYFARSSY